jgi:hypothetical protein
MDFASLYRHRFQRFWRPLKIVPSGAVNLGFGNAKVALKINFALLTGRL